MAGWGAHQGSVPCTRWNAEQWRRTTSATNTDMVQGAPGAAISETRCASSRVFVYDRQAAEGRACAEDVVALRTTCVCSDLSPTLVALFHPYLLSQSPANVMQPHQDRV